MTENRPCKQIYKEMDTRPESDENGKLRFLFKNRDGVAGVAGDAGAAGAAGAAGTAGAADAADAAAAC